MIKSMGYMNKIVNKDRKTGESTVYHIVKLEEQDGKDEFWCLFTEREVRAITPCMLNDDKQHKVGRLYYKHTIGKTTRSFLTLMLQGQRTDNTITYTKMHVVITEALVKRGRNRAARNLEDIPKQSWLANLID